MATETSLSLRDVVAHLLKTHPLICTDTHSHAESVSRVTFTHSKNNTIKRQLSECQHKWELRSAGMSNVDFKFYDDLHSNVEQFACHPFNILTWNVYYSRMWSQDKHAVKLVHGVFLHSGQETNSNNHSSVWIQRKLGSLCITMHSSLSSLTHHYLLLLLNRGL